MTAAPLFNHRAEADVTFCSTFIQLARSRSSGAVSSVASEAAVHADALRRLLLQEPSDLDDFEAWYAAQLRRGRCASSHASVPSPSSFPPFFIYASGEAGLTCTNTLRKSPSYWRRMRCCVGCTLSW
jgi:hypothetical protein